MDIYGKLKTKKTGVLILACLLAFGMVLPSWSNDWSLKDKDGVHYRLSALKGKWVLVNFWASWCPPCLQEMPELAALHKQHKDLQVIGVAVMYRKKQEVLDVVRTQALPYPIVLGSEDIASEFGEVEGLPTSFLYSPSGELVGRHEGPLTQSEVEQAIAQKSGSATLFTR
jgi:thiol-disulfide isomerase/thioredoxin